MNGMALIIAAALIMGLTGLGMLLWAIGSGQYDDPDGAAVRILLDDVATAPAATDGDHHTAA
jgi:cbb3-type cytochrome oxidase maturation protein